MEAVRQQEEAEGKRPRVEAAQPDEGSQLETSTCCRRTWCKKFGKLGMKPEVLKVASAACVSVRAGRWCPAADSFLRRCGDAGNADANFQLGMIEFYCLRRRRQGWSRMKAAMRSGHAEVTFAAAVIRLNGTGSPAVDDRGPRAAARLFLSAASSGHIGALRDLGFCVSNGLGVPRDPAAGRRLTIWVNVQELRDRYPEPGPERDAALAHVGSAPGCLSTGFGCFAAAPRRLGWAHPANRFLGEWFAARPPAPRLRLLCSLPTCGRPETRRLEFRRCTACGVARYCSRACQAVHWRMGHRAECVPVHQWLLAAMANQAAAHVDGALAAAAAPGNVAGFPI
ncbi:hypothetical protein GQ55_1G229300 [Panicum hallii var. hallii]|uniref:MYND-type domain-containing protein n=1 Tax=Panicum hallii var. hallii TaxID=1504633 RepID=A0A2T7F6L7_9POAL|nr:hypothetical protein GQ55_1G229300 [Panicum hallii var. hallii]